MPEYQFWTLVGLMSAGFGFVIFWLRSIDKNIANLDKRLTVIETILSMMGMPIFPKKKVENDK